MSTTTSTARVKAFRQRKRRGAMLIAIEVTPAFIDALIEAKLLAEWDEDSPLQIQHAIKRLFAELMQPRLPTDE